MSGRSAPSNAREFKAWRERLGMSQTQAAALLGTNKFQICRIEAGRAYVTPTLSLLCWLLEDPEIRERVIYYVGMRPTVFLPASGEGNVPRSYAL